MNYNCIKTKENAKADLLSKFPNAVRIIETSKGFLFNTDKEQNIFFKITSEHTPKNEVYVPRPTMAVKKPFEPKILPFIDFYVYENSRTFKIDVQRKLKKEFKRIEADLINLINDETIQPKLSSIPYERDALKKYLTNYLAKL